LRERESRIRALRAEGLSIPAIAAEVGCSPRTVQGVIRSQTDEVADRLDTAIIKTRTTGKTSKPAPADRLAD
jgi:transposase